LLRSFLAIELPKPILKKIEEVQADLKSSHIDVKWVNPEQIHLTLKFFGNIEASKVEPITSSVEGLTQTTPSFPLIVQGIGAFPHLKNPRVIWIGLFDTKEILIPFQKELDVQFEKIGFQAEDRSFHPHLTLGRMKSSRGKEELATRMEKHREVEFGEFQVEKVILFKSDLRPAGPIYTPLKEIKLRG
jgi:2'-5' RNA ligase